MALTLDAAALYALAALVCVAYVLICVALLSGLRAIDELAARLRRALRREGGGAGRRERRAPPRPTTLH